MNELLENPKFWVAVAFVLFVALAYKKISTLLTNALDNRSAKIKAELEQAQALRQEAETVLAEYKRKQAEYTKEAAEILAAAKRDAAQFAEQAERDLKTAVAERTRQATDKIAAEEKKAINEVRDHVVDIALATARAMLTTHAGNMPAEEQARIVLADIERKLH